MSFEQNLALEGAQFVKSGQVVELLLNKEGELIDYSLCYPYFQNKKKDDETIQYGIFSLKLHDQIFEIDAHRFLTARKAEDFLLEVDFSNFHHHSVIQSKDSGLLGLIKD